MKGRNKILAGFLVAISIFVAGKELWDAVSGINADYPENDINGYIAWAAGGATDTISRVIAIYAQDELGANIILQNKTGASGGIATEFVYQQPNDGYSLLFNAENPPLYEVMDISTITYDQFYPVLLFGAQVPVIIVAADSPYQSITQLLADAAARPGELSIGITGAGGLPFNVTAMLQATSGVEFNQIPFDGDSSVVSALMGGHVDISVVNYSAAAELAQGGRLRILTVMDNQRLEQEPDVEAIGEALPEYQHYFPWGAFFGVFVDDRCPDEVKETLTNAFLRAYESQPFQEYLEENYIQPLGLSGNEAKDYILRWQSISAWLLEDAGAAAVSPAQLGIPRLEELEGGAHETRRTDLSLAPAAAVRGLCAALPEHHPDL